MRADVKLFKDQLSNFLAKANQPLHSGGCSHLLDNKNCYCEHLGDRQETLPNVTGRQELPSAVVIPSSMEAIQTTEEGIRFRNLLS